MGPEAMLFLGGVLLRPCSPWGQRLWVSVWGILLRPRQHELHNPRGLDKHPPTLSCRSPFQPPAQVFAICALLAAGPDLLYKTKNI